MADDTRIFDYEPPARHRKTRWRFQPWLGFAGAAISRIVVQFIWMVGVFGNAHRDDIAIITVLSIGAISAFSGFLAGWQRNDNACGSTLFRMLDLVIGCYLIYEVTGIIKRGIY